jgi:hypothetical protein
MARRDPLYTYHSRKGAGPKLVLVYLTPVLTLGSWLDVPSEQFLRKTSCLQGLRDLRPKVKSARAIVANELRMAL